MKLLFRIYAPIVLAVVFATAVTQVNAQCTLLDDMESGQQPFWSTSQVGGALNWAIVTSAQAESPTHVWLVPDEGTIADHYLDLTVNLAPPFQELRFHHTYDMENLFDGGVLEVSSDGGATFVDLGPSITQGGYDGLISNATGNPIGGRMAWTGGVVGPMTEVRVDLTAYVGSSIILRFRQASDSSFGAPGWQIDDIHFCEEGAPVLLTGVEPKRHHLAGGSVLNVLGSGMTQSVSLAIRSGGTTIPLENQVFANGSLMAGTIPAADEGTYDVVAMDGGGNDLFVLDNAVSIVEALLPPPGDVEAVRLGDEARLSWSNLVALDSIRVLRNGAMIDLLDGGATTYVDDIAGLPVGDPIDYEIIGHWNGIDSYSSEFTVAAIDPCETSARLVLGSGFPGFERPLLFGGDTNETQTAFRLTLPAPDGVIVRVHAARVAEGGVLRARLRELDPPQNIVADDVFLEDLGVSQIPYWVEGFVPGPLPAGDYVLGFYVDGGDPATAHFAVVTCEDDDDRGDPYPCPPYPLATVERVCGDTPPQITDVEVHPFNPNTPLLSLEPLSIGPPSFTGLSIASTTLVHLEAVVIDPGDRSIVEYKWESFGDGESGISASPWVTHRFPHYGAFDVRLTVTNDLGLSSTSTKTISVLPFPGPLAAGSPPEIVSLTSTPDHYVPDIAAAITVPVPGTFEVIVNSAAGATITSVSGVLDDPNGGPVTFFPVASSPAIWRGVFSDMSVLTRGTSVDLILTATDDMGMMDVETFPVGLCPIPEVLGLSLNGIDRQVLYNPSTHDYTVISNYIPDRIVDFSFSLGSLMFENYLEITASSEIFLQGKRWLAGDLDGGIEAKLMNSTLYSQAWNLPAKQTTSPVECPDFVLQYLIENIKLLDRTRSVTVLDNEYLGSVVVPVWVLVFVVDFFANLSLDIHLQAYLDILITLANLDPELTLDFCSTPSVGVDAEASLDARVSLFRILRLVTLTAILYPEVDFSLPSHLQIEATPFDVSLDVSHCVEVDVDYELAAKGPFGNTWSSGRKNIGFLDNLEFGPGCGLPSPCGLGPQRGGSASGAGSVPLPSTPAIATSPSGHSLMVWSLDVDPDPAVQQLELYFASDTGAGWTAPASVLGAHDLFADTEPELAFLDDDRAVLVWIRNSLDRNAVQALAQGSLASLNTILRNQEVWFAEWSVGGGWGTASALTSNALAEGFPQVATIAGADTAWVTWIGYDLAQVVDESTGIPNDHESSIYAQPIVSGVPGAVVLLSSDDGGAPVADFSPTIAFAPDGTGLAMWVRETVSDRMLMVSAFDGSSFAAPVASYGTPEYSGVDQPSVALGSGGQGIATFTSRTTAGAAAMDAGDRTTVYAMPLDGGFLDGFSSPQRIVGSRCLEIAFAEEAQAMQLAGSSTFLVGARSFSSAAGGIDVDGELAVAAIDLSRPTPTFSTWRPLTSNGAIDYDVAFSMAPGGMLRSVRTSTLGDPTFGDLVPEDFATGPDLAVERLRLSRAHPRPGSEVDVTAVIHNRGIASASSLATTLRVGTVVDGAFVEIDNQPFSFDAAADGRQEVDYRFVVPPETTTIRIRVDVLGEETRSDNNEADVVLGVRPPSNLTCAETAGSELDYLVHLTWTGEDRYDAVLVYRNGRLRAELPGGAVSYFDDSASLGHHVYSVRGRIGSSISDPAGAVCDFTVADCNGNGMIDLLDVLTGASPDCNGNLRPDECDLGKPIPAHERYNYRGGALNRPGSKIRTNDRNGNGIPDDCE